jgi:hypothetical protein
MTRSHMDVSPRWGAARKLLSLVEDNAASFDPETWADPDHGLSNGNALWSQYVVLVDLYKHYLDIAWKASVWYYAITGAIVTYYLREAPEQPPGPLPLVLLFLATVSVGFATLYVKAAGNFISMRDVLEEVAVRLHLPGRPHVEFAVDFVVFNAALMTALALGALVLFAADFGSLAWP